MHVTAWSGSKPPLRKWVLINKVLNFWECEWTQGAQGAAVGGKHAYRRAIGGTFGRLWTAILSWGDSWCDQSQKTVRRQSRWYLWKGSTNFWFWQGCYRIYNICIYKYIYILYLSSLKSRWGHSKKATPIALPTNTIADCRILWNDQSPVIHFSKIWRGRWLPGVDHELSFKFNMN